MSAKILKGEPIAKKLRDSIAQEIQQRNTQGYRAPALAVILLGDHHASQLYVRKKKAACLQVGIHAVDHHLPSHTTQIELLGLIDELNRDPAVDGILVQMPLPAQINPADIVESIDPEKDVDGFHPYNLGRLAQGRPYLRPCTPAGVMQLLAHTGENLIGKTATVVGTSNIVGRPMILELLLAGVTVTACNKKTRDLAQALANADIVIVAAGCHELIKGAWIKSGAIVIDVGINRKQDGSIAGDVEFEIAKQRAAWITPVPGGVGPMTIANLLHNCLIANIKHQIHG